MRCFACNSTSHLFKDCPKNTKSNSKVQEVQEVQEVQIVLLNAKPDNKQKTLVLETLGKGLLDSGCTRTVAGEFWMNEFLTTALSANKHMIKEEESNSDLVMVLRVLVQRNLRYIFR